MEIRRNKGWGKDETIKTDEMCGRSRSVELGLLQSQGRAQVPFLFANEIPLCSACDKSVWNYNILTAY